MFKFSDIISMIITFTLPQPAYVKTRVPETVNILKKQDKKQVA